MAKDNIEVKIEGNLDRLKKLKEVVDEYKKHKVKVGVFGGSYPDGTPYASVGMLHEFGSVTKKTFNYHGEEVTISGIPARSWLRVPVKKAMKNKGVTAEYAKLKVIEELEEGKYEGKGLEIMGMYCKDEIIESFATDGYGKWPRNISKKYIELKGSDVPLRDTGALWQAVTYEIE